MASDTTILLVDDETSILDVAGEFFRLKGYRVLTAENGNEALAVIESNPVDCCFTDINMPEMDGLRLAENIRQIDNAIPVIVMTGYPSLDNTIHTLKNGVVDFLIKPVNLNQMEICLQRVLRERKLFAENLFLKAEVEQKQKLEHTTQELHAKVDELNVLNKIMSDFSSLNSSTSVLSRIVELATEISGGNESRFFLVNESIDEPVLVTSSGNTPDGDSQDSVSNLAAREVDTALAGLVREAATDALPMLVGPSTNGRGPLPPNITSLMAVPLTIRNQVFGVLATAAVQSTVQFTERDLYFMSFLTQNASKAIENLALYDNIYENLFATLLAFAKAVEARDSYTQHHSNRVTELAVAVGTQMGCSTEQVDMLNLAGRLHDIGKIGIPDNILLKPGRLTDEEFEKIKEHPQIGAEIISQLGMWDREQEIIRSHHERFDGSGYPHGLKGNEIPYLARILSVCDAYDAMASNRVYRNSLDMDRILNILRDCAGTQFDPDVVDVFLQLHESGGLDHIAETASGELTEPAASE